MRATSSCRGCCYDADGDDDAARAATRACRGARPARRRAAEGEGRVRVCERPRRAGDAVLTRTETTTRPALQLGRVGELVPRVDAPPKVKGEFAYASDLIVPGMLWGHTLRSPHAHARIVSIDISEAVTMDGVHAVLTHDDVPGQKTYGLEFPDQPVLAIDRVLYFGEPVAVVAAEHPEQARRAAERIRVAYEPLDPVIDMERATEQPPLHAESPPRG